VQKKEITQKDQEVRLGKQKEMVLKKRLRLMEKVPELQ
jgi:hypothetical protein